MVASRAITFTSAANAPRRSRISAFSLIEIVLAVGIISFALVGILGLFPVALQAAAQSREETQAAFIARAIYSDLSGNPAFLTPDDTTVINLKSPSPTTLSRGYDENGILTTASAKTIYEATVTFTPDNPTAGLTRVDVEIAAPASAPANSSGRHTYPFVSLLRQIP